MNIFVTSHDPVESAQALDDVRVNKMIVESVQMLATALHLNGVPKIGLPKSKSGAPYRPTHSHHPCTQWVAKSVGNYMWLLEHLRGLLEEFELRFGKKHFCETAIPALENGLSMMPPGVLESFQNASTHKGVYDTTIAYQCTLNEKWDKDKIQVKWTLRYPPSWCMVSFSNVNGVYRKT